MIEVSRRRQLLMSTATLLVAVGFVVGPVPALAVDEATWLTTPGSNVYNTGTNWDPNTGPDGPTVTAFFGMSNTRQLTVAPGGIGFTVGGWTFTADTDYEITNETRITFIGQGIDIEAGSAKITNDFSMSFFGGATVSSADITNNVFLEFGGSSTAGSAKIDNFGELRVIQGSSAGSAEITNFAGGRVRIAGSSAGASRIRNEDFFVFATNSTAANANVVNAGFFVFTQNSTAAGATVVNNELLRFEGNSTAGQAQLTTTAGARTDFSDSEGPAGDRKLSAGSLAGTGQYFLGANELTVGGNGLSTEVSGVISDCGSTGIDCVTPGVGGSLVKTGAGTLTLLGANTYTGSTTVKAGALVVNGSITSDVTVNSGRLGGTGTVGALTVNTGGTLAPGNSIGTMIVNGSLSLEAGSIFEVEVNAAGKSDTMVVNGTVNLTGATLRVLAANGNYAPSTDYTIIENDGQDAVSGTFGTVTTNLAFLTPFVDYAAGDGNDVVLTLIRNDIDLKDVAKTDNQKAVAGALDEFTLGNPLFLSVLTQTAEGARQAFNVLSGEVHATVAGVLVDDSRYAREAVLGRMMQASHTGGALGAGGPQSTDRGVGYGADAMRLGGADTYNGKSLVELPQSSPLAFWTQGYGAWGTFDGDGNAATADRNLGGFISGMDADFWNGWRVGIATGASFSDVSVDQRYSGANTQTYHLGGYVNGDLGGFALRGGGLWAWTDIETSRAVVFPNFFERQKADYDADTGQLFGEIAYPTQMGGIEVEPFAGLAYVSVESSGFKERGGPEASLRTSGFDQDVGYTTVGLRAARTMMWGNMAATPRIEAAWLHAFDDVTPGASLAFATTGIGFDVDGVPLAEDSALLDVGVDFALSDRLNAGVSYSGQYAENVTDNGVKGRFTWLF